MQAQYYTSLIFPFLLLLDVFLVGKLDFKRALGNCALFELTLFILKFFFVRRESYFFFFKRYAHENGCPWDERTCDNAYGEMAIGCFLYAHIDKCPSGVSRCHKSAALQYLKF